MSKFIIGVTGKSGSGKTTFCKNLAMSLRAYHIDIDTVCHTMIHHNRNAIEGIIMSIDKAIIPSLYNFPSNDYDKQFRRAVGELIFSDKEKYKEIVSLVWKYSKSFINDRIEQDDPVILDHILLPTMHYWQMCDRKILIKCDDITRYKRIFDRDKLTLDYLYKREKSSIEYTDYEFDVIRNTTNE